MHQIYLFLIIFTNKNHKCISNMKILIKFNKNKKFYFSITESTNSVNSSST